MVAPCSIISEHQVNNFIDMTMSKHLSARRYIVVSAIIGPILVIAVAGHVARSVGSRAGDSVIITNESNQCVDVFVVASISPYSVTSIPRLLPNSSSLPYHIYETESYDEFLSCSWFFIIKFEDGKVFCTEMTAGDLRSRDWDFLISGP
jgi:hypothetical protein